MAFNIPLFAFGVCIVVLVGIGVLLALAEFRQAHDSLPSDRSSTDRPRTFGA